MRLFVHFIEPFFCAMRLNNVNTMCRQMAFLASTLVGRMTGMGLAKITGGSLVNPASADEPRDQVQYAIFTPTFHERIIL